MPDATFKPPRPWDEYPEILDTVTVSEITGYAKRTLEGKRLRGEPPPARKLMPGRAGKVIYMKAELRAWLEGAATTFPGTPLSSG